MATEPGTLQAAARGDAFVADRLAHTEQRIRSLDLAAAGLGFIAGTCVYAALMVVADPLISRVEVARQFLFLGYLVSSAVYLATFVIRPLTRRINPYFAARQVERTLPGSKNSVVNWIDLHGQPLPPAIRNALGLRAAKDLARADLDSAISGRRAGIAGGLAGVGAAILVVLLLTLGGGPFFDGIKRAFAPFAFSGPSRTRTRVTLVRPDPGDLTIPVGRGVSIAVDVTGKVPDPKGPDAVRLQYRYGEGDPWLERPMAEGSGSEFTVMIGPSEVRSGFWYKAVAGDGETPEYRVSVCSTPQLVDFQATYHFPKYAAMPHETRRERELRAVRGSEVVVWALTNRTLREAHLDFDSNTGSGRKTFVGHIVAGDPEAFQVPLQLREDGNYRLAYTSVEGEEFSEPFNPVKVLTDLPPEVSLIKPGADVALPTNGMLLLEGRARDDFGVRELTLRMKSADRVLRPQRYRSPEALHLEGGGYPLFVAYKDAVDLAGLQADDSGPFRAAVGNEIEYWLEANDACEPKPNTGASKHYRVKLTEPQKDEAKQKADREQAKKEQQQHEAKQDQQLKQEADARKEQSKEEEQKEQHGKRQDKGEKGQNGANGTSAQQSQKQDGDPAEKNQSSGSDGQGQKNQSSGSESRAEKKQSSPASGNSASENTGSKQDGGENSENTPPDSKQDADARAKADRLNQVLNQNKSQHDSSDSQGSGKEGDTRKEEVNNQSAPKSGQEKTSQSNGSGSDKREQNGDSREQKQNSSSGDNKSQGAQSAAPSPQQGENSPPGSEKKEDTSSKEGAKNSADSGARGERKPDAKSASNPGPMEKTRRNQGDSKRDDKNGSAANTPGQQPKDRTEDKKQSGTKQKPEDQPRAPSDPRQKGSDTSATDQATKPNPHGTKDQQPGKSDNKKQDRKDAAAGEQGNEGANSLQQRQEKSNDAKEGSSKNQPKPDDGTREQKHADKSPSADSDKNGQQPGEKSPSSSTGADKNGQQQTEKSQSSPASSDKNGHQPGEKSSSSSTGADKNGQRTEKSQSLPGKSDKDEAENSPHSTNRQSASAGNNHEKNRPGESGADSNRQQKYEPGKTPGDPKQASPEDVQKAAKALQDADPDKRAEARKQLEQMSKQATDQKSRDDARKALESSTRSPDRSESADKNDKQGGQKDGDQSNGKQDASADKRGDAGKPDRQGSEGDKTPGGKSDPGMEHAASGEPGARDSGTKSQGNQTEGKGPGQGGTGDATKPGMKRGQDPRDNKGADRNTESANQPDQAGKTGPQDRSAPQSKDDRSDDPRGGNTSRRAPSEPRRDPDNLPEPPAPNPLPNTDKPRHLDKHTELQLEDLDKVTKKDLEAANLTEKDLAALRQWLQQQKKHKPKPDAKDSAVAPQHGGPGGPISSGRLQPGTAGKPNDLSNNGRASPPPGYREANEAFKRLINKSDANGP